MDRYYYTYSDSLLRLPDGQYKRLSCLSIISYQTYRSVAELRGEDAVGVLMAINEAEVHDISSCLTKLVERMGYE